jgi:hypothetical protein
MNNLLIQPITKHLHPIMILTVTLVGAGFAPGPLLAQSPTPTCTPVPRKACEKWPCKGSDSVTVCDDKRDKVKEVFVTLLNEASDGTPHGKQLRKDLLCPKDGYQLAHKEVETRLGKILAPLGPVPFGPEHNVMFYEPEKSFDETGGNISFNPKYPDKHCIHIFGLKEEGTPPLPNNNPDETSDSFNLHLKCCYKPW